MNISQKQISGTILGLAIGDAVGSVWEGITPDMIYDMGPADVIVAHESGDTIYYTDDTQMMISVVQTLIEDGTISKEPLMQRFVDNYHPDRGYGQGAREIINAAGFGEDWEAKSASLFGGEGSLGNGGAMRVAPLGVFFASDLQKVAQQAAESSTLTHFHEIGVDGTVLLAIAAALAALSSGQPLKRIEFLKKLRTFAKTEEFQWQIEHAMKLEAMDSLIAFGNSLEAHRSVMTSILCFAGSPDDFELAVSRAIGQGDDVDTLAAMTGALVGARLGFDALPNHLLDALEDNYQGKSFLLELADQLWRRFGESNP